MSAADPDDVARLRAELARLEPEAARLRWAEVRPWSARTHVGWDREVPTVNLADLGDGLAARAVREVASVAGELGCGAVAFVTGRGGRGTAGPRSGISRSAQAELVRVCAEREGWAWRVTGHDRLTLVTDPARTPGPEKGELGLGFKVFGVFLALAALVALANLMGLL